MSGGYGIVDARESIGIYNRRLNPKDWPGTLLAEVIAAYARSHRLTRLAMFLSASTGYARVMRRRPRWQHLGITEAILYSPEATSSAYKKAARGAG